MVVHRTLLPVDCNMAARNQTRMSDTPLSPVSPLQPPRAWQRMLSGRRLDLLDPKPGDIEISDIARGLARVARWNGQTAGQHAFSVAQHSRLVEAVYARLADDTSPRWRLAALLHDAPEYVIGDLISPFKAVIGTDYKAIENRLLAAIHERFGLPARLPGTIAALVKDADRIAAYWEATRLAGFSESEALLYFGHPCAALTEIEVQSITEPEATAAAEQAFLACFERLTSV